MYRLASATAIMLTLMSVPILELRNLSSIRAGIRVLHDLSFRIMPGQHTAILGPNGSGKSSLMRLLMLEDRPLPGEDGPPLKLFGSASWDLMELRKRLGVVTGDLDDQFGMSTSRGRVRGLDVALSGLFGGQGVFSHYEVTTEMRDRAAEALVRVKASHLATKPLNEMSTGERRRVLIARALITRPDALLLDEPTSGLDIVARQRFMETVRELARHGTTTILVTHHVEEVVPEIDRVVLLRAGRIAFDGAAAEAFTPNRLEFVFGAPVDVTSNAGYFHVRLA